MSVTLKLKAPCAVLTVNGHEHHVERIGKGRYCTAWRNGAENVWLQVHESDLSKDALADCSSNPHLPKVERFDWFDDNAPFRLYREPLYQPLLARHKQAWADFRQIYKLWNDAHSATCQWNDMRNVSVRVNNCNTAFAELVGASTLAEPLKEAVRELVEQAACYGDYQIEISKRNCAVDSAGNLILLDPMFDRAELEQDRAAKMKRTRIAAY